MYFGEQKVTAPGKEKEMATKGLSTMAPAAWACKQAFDT